MSKGYYSLIQWCEDFARAEAANVGVVVFRPEPAATGVRVAEDVGHVRRRFGLSDADVRGVVEAVRAIRYRLANTTFQSLAELEQFVRSRGNQIQLTTPRPMRVDDPQLDAERMFAELVSPVRAGEMVEVSVAQRLPQLVGVFRQLQERAPTRVFVDRTFPVQDIDLPPVHADYAYRNGHLNLVQACPIPRLAEHARRDALALHALGEIVHARLTGERGATLTVVADPGARAAGEMETVMARLIRGLAVVRFVSSTEVEQFAREVETDVLHSEQ